LPRFDRAHFVEMGRRYYKLASEEQLAEVVGQRIVLTKLSQRFEFYMDALGEMSERYIMGFDMQLIADKMLDGYNRYRATHSERDMASVRHYASILRPGGAQFPR
jgi:hypothetical protein